MLGGNKVSTPYADNLLKEEKIVYHLETGGGGGGFMLLRKRAKKTVVNDDLKGEKRETDWHVSQKKKEQ